uniref:Uncharacterized protein n=1 Tax=Kalanchoe fedtschenkoi TaxID=63787 RepID=A0A7N0VLM0_KALFE
MPVKGVSVQGLGLGTARGAVPRARIAVYKVCWLRGGCGGDLTKAVNDAIMDGVDIVSASISEAVSSPRLYIDTTWPSANFNAMRHGVLVSLTAGNKGPGLYRVANTEPWVMTVANSAGSGTDYETYVNLGDGKRFLVAGANPHDTGKTMMPLALGSDVKLPGYNETSARGFTVCRPEEIDPKLAQGKFILCEAVMTVREIFDLVGCAGVLVRSAKPDDMFDQERGRYMSQRRKAPVVILSQQDFQYLLAYYRNATSAGGVATASIEKSVDAPDSKPRAATSSSRGPSKVDINILKPDISAPGVNVIAAMSGDFGPAYDMQTGTSMSCPHASGVAAYIKSFHPDWSPAFVKSAVMTTATPMVPSASNKVYELAYGAGQINPLGALDPGLVYDLQEIDYVKYLCQWSNFNQSAILALSGVRDWECSKLPLEKGWTLNYPSFSIPGVPDQPFVSVFHRTLTNVGNPPTSNYKAIVSAPEGLEIIVEPSVLAFTQNLEKLSYTITIKGLIKKGGDVLSAYLVWTDGRHSVRSPIIAFERPKDIEAIYEEQMEQPHG